MKKFRALILGKSNVGKSSLVNYLGNNHSALVSNKLHSSRISISHEFQFNAVNIELVDTPGASIENNNLLSQAMKSHASKHILDSDLIILLTQPQKNYTYEMKILNQIKECKKKYLFCVNKVDLDLAEKFKIKLLTDLKIKQYISISVKESLGMDNLLSMIDKHMRQNITTVKNSINNNNERYIIQELIRETLINRTNKEVPYESAVCIKDIKTKNDCYLIKADLIVSKNNHKKILIGKNGDMIKKIGMISRKNIESYFKNKIHLSLFVVVKENWKNDTDILKEIGYID